MKKEAPPMDSDINIRRLARKRAAFKRNLASYVAVNTFLIIIWLFTSGWHFSWGGFWPAWVLLGWGLGLLFNYRDAYDDKLSSAEDEYNRLLDQRGGVPMSEEDEIRLWTVARKHSEYRHHLFTYVVINVFLVAIWMFTVMASGWHFTFFWPIFPILGWGIGLFFHQKDAYGKRKGSDVEQEYERLRKEKMEK